MTIKEESKNLIGQNKFYFLMNNQGYYFKTSFFKDFNAVKNWDKGDILFSGIVKNSNTLHIQVGHTWIKKRISELHIAKPQNEIFYWDIEQLVLKTNSNINKIKIGGYQIPETIESL